MTIKTTRRRVLSGVAAGTVAAAVAPLPVSAGELDDALTPQEQYDACVKEGVRWMMKGGDLLERHGKRIRTPYDDMRGLARPDPCR